MQTKLKIKKGDTVKVIAGAAVGQEGNVLDIDHKNERVFVEGLSVLNKKHVKPQSDKANPDGGIVANDRSIHISNVMVVDAAGNITRVGRRRNDAGKLTRYSKKSNEDLK